MSSGLVPPWWGVCVGGEWAGLTHLFANLYRSQQEPAAPLGSLHALLWGFTVTNVL